jgi:peptide/nickel transport system substrate-binding protein
MPNIKNIITFLLDKLPFRSKNQKAEAFALSNSTKTNGQSNLRQNLEKWYQESSWPTRHQWQQFFKILTKKERYYFISFLVLIFISVAILAHAWYLNSTKIIPAAGGTYTEAAIGSPHYINPVLAAANDTDRDVSSLIFSSLIKHDDGKNIVFDLAEKYSISQDKKSYDVSLRKNIKWQDNKPLTADDIVYTVNVIKNPDYRSPLRTSLQGVDIEKVDDLTVRFTLKNPYSPFIDNLNFGILPKHIWENIPSSSFSLSENNLKPIGSGPYKFKSLQKDETGAIKTLELTAFSDYYAGRPYLDNITLKFFKDEDSAIVALNSGSSDGISYISANNIAKLKTSFVLNEFNLSRYFAVFFNSEQNKDLADKNVRQALADGTNKKEIIDKILPGQAISANSPLPDFILSSDSAKLDMYPDSFDPEKAKNELDAAGWKIPVATSTNQALLGTNQIRQKTIDNQNTSLEISILTVNLPELVDVANVIKAQWETLSIKVNLDVQSVADIQDRIRNRDYQTLLFGQILGANPDPFAFWHSSQKKDPGLNLSQYENSEVDKLLEQARQETDINIRIQEYNRFQKIVVQDVPAVFLYTPLYIFPTKDNIKGIDTSNAHLPQDRFMAINKWYIKTTRGWK